MIVNGEPNCSSGIPQGSVLGPCLFIMFVNELPELVHSGLQMFADDTKLFCKIQGSQDCQKLQQDIDSLILWANQWQMQFNASKCKIMHIGKKNPGHNYHMDINNTTTEIQETDLEKDLGVNFDPSLEFSQHCALVAKRANQKLGLIRASFTYLDKDTLTLLYKSVVRPILEYCNTVWHPLHKKDSKTLEAVQRRATKLVPGLAELSSWERLRALKLPSLKYMRLRNDILQVYKLLHKDYDVQCNYLKQTSSTRTRGHSLKLKKLKPVWTSVRIVLV